MKTDLIQTVITLMKDDQGVNQMGYFCLKQLLADNYGEKAANRLGTIVAANDDRYYINSDAGDLEIYDYISG